MRIRQQRIWQEFAERKTAGKGHEDAGNRDRDRGLADLPDQLEVGLHAGQQQQQQDAELRDAVDHRFLLGRFGEDCLLCVRPDPTEQRGTEQDAGEQFADHRGLAEALHDLAETAADRDQQHDLGHQQEFRGTGRFAALGAGRNGGEDKRRGDKADRSEQAPLHAGILPLHLPRRGAGMTGIEPAAGNRSSLTSRRVRGLNKKSENNPMHSRDEVEKTGENFVFAEI
ncbi:hypothetical protein ACVWZV_003597 [Bradyrhizobium sp. GM5.1]